jgi:hypothetical protein
MVCAYTFFVENLPAILKKKGSRSNPPIMGKTGEHDARIT